MREACGVREGFILLVAWFTFVCKPLHTRVQTKRLGGCRKEKQRVLYRLDGRHRAYGSGLSKHAVTLYMPILTSGL